jgi:hypothetical protein
MPHPPLPFPWRMLSDLAAKRQPLL